MSVDLVSRRRAAIKRKIRAANQKYPFLWRRMIQEWRKDEAVDALWLTYSANYLLRTAGVRWALDPFSLLTRTGGAGQPDFAGNLAGLQLVVLSHAHADHFDPNLLAAIADLPLAWVVPEFMLERLLRTAALPMEHVVIPRIGAPVSIGGLTLTPFESLHIHPLGGLPEIGYLAEFSGKRWLFPGDIRSYHFEQLPDFGRLDGVLAHLWLGKACALLDDPPRLEEFCRFFARLAPRRIVVAHLDEMGREAEDYWTQDHYRMAASWLGKNSPEIDISYAMTGQRVRL